MNIGKMIKTLRRERDMTQEQLAEYLNISSQAVSRWETDLAMPDITSLPMLANIFDVSVDHLLGVDIENKNKKIEAIKEEANEYFDRGYSEEAAEIYREALKQYPNNYELMYWLMYASKNNDEIIKLGEKILAESTENSLRHGAVQILCYTYPIIGRREEAIKLAEAMPPSCVSRECLLANIYTGNERFKHRQYTTKSALNDFIIEIICNNNPLDDGTLPYSLEDNIIINKKIIEILETMFEDEDYGFFQQRMEWIYIYIASDYAKLGDDENSLKYLELAQKHAILSDTECDPEKTYTSILFKGMKYGGGAHNITSNDSLYQLEQMNHSEFDFIREDARFTAIEDELKKYAKKH